MSDSGKRTMLAAFAAGVLAGALILQAVLKFGGFAIVDQEELTNQQKELAELRYENDELFDELFSPEIAAQYLQLHGELPYDESADAREVVETARAQAIDENKYLMVTFGANWCLDCRTLSKVLQNEEVSAYTQDRFNFVNVDVGKFNRNKDVAEDLGVSLQRGIPVAIFFTPDGEVIGTTNDGQLEPARRYTSKQIFKFVRDIAERSLILAPDEIE